MAAKVPIEEALRSAPKNWGRWGPDDEIGALNFLTSREVLEAAKCVRQGKVFTLGLLVGRKEGDPVWPGRSTTVHLMVNDEGFYRGGKTSPAPGNLKYADDAVFMYLQGTTQVDALGHVWHGDKIYNGYSSDTTIGGLSKDSIVPIAKKGIVGRGVLLDVARYRGVDHLARGEVITLEDLKGAAAKQGVEIRKHDIILVRTGYLKVFYEQGPEAYYKDFNEPGITYSKELVDWFYNMEIASYGTDTIASEQTYSSTTGTPLPMHIILLNFLGVPIQELLWLEELAEDCAKDGQYDFLYVCSPLKVVGGTGSPVNPVAIK